MRGEKERESEREEEEEEREREEEEKEEEREREHQCLLLNAWSLKGLLDMKMLYFVSTRKRKADLHLSQTVQLVILTNTIPCLYEIVIYACILHNILAPLWRQPDIVYLVQRACTAQSCWGLCSHSIASTLSIMVLLLNKNESKIQSTVRIFYISCFDQPLNKWPLFIGTNYTCKSV